MKNIMRQVNQAVNRNTTNNTRKRVLSFVLALVFILAVLPSSILPEVRATESSGLGPVRLYVRMNGVDNYDEVELEAGVIAEHIGDVEVDNLPDGAEFIKAVLVDYDTSIETEVKSVGADGDDIYYSLNEEDNAGTLLENNQDLVLVYGNRYIVNDVKTGEGSYTIIAHSDVDELGNSYQYLWAKEDLVIQAIEPANDWSLDSVKFNSGSSNGTATVKNNSATIPYTKIKGDITVRINFVNNENYSITEGTIAQGGICQDQGVVKQSYIDNQEVDPVAPGETATFMLYSQSWTGGDKWIVNQLMLNGEDVNVPRTTTIGDSAETDLSNGSHVTVTLVKTEEGLYWKKGDPEYYEIIHQGEFERWNKQRCLYEVTITNVHENYVVDGNFKDSTKRELIIKGLEGIELTGAAEEDIRLISGFSVMQRYYTFTSAESNIYTANYTRPIFSESIYPSDNLILYTVKYGYNPYTVETRIFYDGVESDSVRAASVTNEGEEAAAGKPVDVIANAKAQDYDDDSTGRFDTSFRHWGKNDNVLQNTESTYRPSFSFSSKDLLLTTIDKDKDNDWYAVALAQNAALDQQLYLNAKPYEFKLNLDVTYGLPDQDGLFFSDDAFEGDLDAYKEKTGNTVVGNHAYTYLPTVEPQKEGYIFQCWQLVDAKGNVIENTKRQKSQYAAGDQFKLTEENVNLVMAESDPTKDEQNIYFRAVWKEIQESDKTYIDVSAYRQISADDYALKLQNNPDSVTVKDGTYYYRYYNQREKQNVGKIELLNLHAKESELGAPAEYYVLNKTNSVLSTTAKKLDDNGELPTENYLSVYYDYKTVNVNLEKEVKGKPKTKEYTITLTLTKTDDSPITVSQAVTMMGLAQTDVTQVTENSITISKKFGKGSTLALNNVPYGWTYVLDEDQAENEDDYTQEYEPTGILIKDTTIVVTNTGKNPGIEVDKQLHYDSDTDEYSIDLAAYATGETYTQQLDTAVPLDIAIVINQSSSLTTEDVNKYTLVKDGNTNKTSWTISEASGKYIRVGTRYYPVEQYSQDAYVLVGHRGDLLPYDMTTGFSLFTDYADTDYYAAVNNEMKQIQCKTKGYMVGFSSHEHLFGENDPQYIAGGGYHLYLRYKDGNSYTNIPTYEGWDEADYKADTIITDFVTTYRLGVDVYKKVTVYGLKYKDANNNYVYLSLPSHTSIESDNGTVYYITDEYTVDNQSSSVTFVDSSGRINSNGQTLYSQSKVARLKALQDAANIFLEKIAAQAEENDVDHRVAVIGYANNEYPSRTSTSDNIVGDSEYITVNTGLFINGQFKNYMTPVLNNSSATVSAEDFESKVTVTRTGHWAHYDYHYAYSINNNPYSNLTFFTQEGYPVRYKENVSLITEKCLGQTSTTYNEPTYNTFNNYVCYKPDTNGNYVWSPYIWKDKEPLESVTTYTAPQPYYPNMQTLAPEDYQAALVSAGRGNVNTYLTDAIDNLGAYGEGYLSYGLSMANNVFQYNSDTDASGQERKRVIVVFTDGEYMESGEEAIAAASISKDDYGATIYTVGLHPDGQANSSAEDTLQQISSMYYASTTDVYEDTLSSNGTYYFQDEYGRTSSTTIRNSSKTNVTFSEKTIGDRTIPVTSDSGGTTAQYTWYDDNGWVRAAKTDSSDDRLNFYQFFKLGNSKPAGDSATYYYNADDAESLEAMFEVISEQVKFPTTTVRLNGENSMMVDGITDYFDCSDAEVQYLHYTADVEDVEDGIPWESIKPQMGLDGSLEDNYLRLNGFDYSTNYISEEKGEPGKILAVTISGLKLKEGVTGEDIPSNIEGAGIYYNDDLIAEFEPQYTDAGSYSAKVKLQYIPNENNLNPEDQRFNVTFELTKSDGTPYVGKYGDTTYSSEGIFTTTMKNGDPPKEITGIPKHAILTVKVSDPDNANTYYTYVITDYVYDDDGNPIIEDGSPVIGRISNPTNPQEGKVENIRWDHPHIVINVTDNRQVFTVTNHTQKSDEDDEDFSDKTKKFPLKLTLYQGEDLVTEDVSFIDQSGEPIVFEDGMYIAELMDEESLILFIPDGYTIKVEDETEPSNYITKYQLDGGSLVDDPVSAQFQHDNHAVDVYHSIHKIVISGVVDAIQRSPYPYIVGLIVLIGLAWTWIQRRRKRMKAS